MFPLWLDVSGSVAGWGVPAHSRREAAEAKFVLSSLSVLEYFAVKNVLF